MSKEIPVIDITVDFAFRCKTKKLFIEAIMDFYLLCGVRNVNNDVIHITDFCGEL